jgi:poly(3-hydroxybutyrate) depolymerase
MKKLLILMMAVSCSMMLMAAKENKFYNLQVNGKTRSYLLYVPNNVKDSAPLVISLHGAGGVVAKDSHDPDFNSIADKDGFIVAYPQGLQTTFPGLGGMQAPGWTSTGEENFDTDFLKAVVEDIDSKYTLDRKRLYCCGFSNGGMMTYVMANTCSHIFAAFAAISGYPINEFHLHHTSWRPVPFLHIHGKADDFVKYSLVPNIIDNMVARNGANPVPTTTTKSGKYTKNVYEAGEGGFPVIFYEIDGMGHSPFTNNTEVGSSSQTMWNFFKEYTLDAPCDTTLKWRPRIETEGYDPKSHGWSVNGRTAILRFGGDQNTDENQNVYHSLQFKSGSYKLCFHSEGEEGKNIKVKIEKLTGQQNAVLNTTVAVGGDTTLPFEVNDGWGEYRITFSRENKNDVITITNIGIYSSNADEPASVSVPQLPTTDSTPFFDLLGRPVKGQPLHNGIYIHNGKKAVVGRP